MNKLHLLRHCKRDVYWTCTELIQPEAREVDDVVGRYGAGVETDLGCHNMLR